MADTNWTAAILSGLMQAYLNRQSAQQQQDKAKYFQGPFNLTTTKTPYYNEAISQMVPYLLQEGLGIYQDIQHKNGRTAGSFNLPQLMSSIAPGYTGVNGPNGSATANALQGGSGGYGAISGPSMGGSNGQSGSEGVLNDLNQRGNTLSDLTDNSGSPAYNVTSQDLSHLGDLVKQYGPSILKGAGGLALGGVTGGLGLAANAGVSKLYDMVRGLMGKQGDPTGTLDGVPKYNLPTNLAGQAMTGLPNGQQGPGDPFRFANGPVPQVPLSVLTGKMDHFTTPVDPWTAAQKNPFQGTGSWYDWGGGGGGGGMDNGNGYYF